MTQRRAFHRPSFCHLGIFLLVSSTLACAQEADQISRLITRLGNDQTAWSASAELQKLGNPAVQGLIANLKKDPIVGELHYSRTLITLEKMGPRVIPIVTATLLAEPYPPGESRQVYRELERYRFTLIEALGALGSEPVPSLVRIAEAGPTFDRDRALRAILGPALDLFLGLNSSFDPWRRISPTAREIEQRGKAIQPFLARIRVLMEEDRSHWRPQWIAPELPAAFILALWGSGELKQAGLQVLRQLAQTDEPFYRHDEPIRMLALLGDKSAPALLKANLPPSSYELKDQLLIFTGQWLFRLGDQANFKTVLPAFSSKDMNARWHAVSFADESRDLRFVPILIPLLNDATPTGLQTCGEGAHAELMGDWALEVLRHLTFQSLPKDSAPWEKWWDHNRTTPWQQLLRLYLAQRMADLGNTPYWGLNTWVAQLRGAYDPDVLPLLDQYVRHPQLDVHATGPGQGEGMSGSDTRTFPWGPPPTAVTLLLGIAEQGNSEAVRMLRTCLTSHDREVRVYGALALTGFSCETAIEGLAQEALKEEYSKSAVEALLKLGDRRGIGILIDRLALYQNKELEWMRTRDYELLLKFTQEDIGYKPQGSIEEQNEGLKEWRKWWEQNQADFRPRSEAAAIDDRFYFAPAHASVAVTP